MNKQVEEICSCGRGRRQLRSKTNGRRLTYSMCSRCAEEADMRITQANMIEHNMILQLKVLSAEIYAYFDSRYMEHWTKHFAFTPSKKEVWKTLHAYGIVQTGLTHFYNQLRDWNIEEYLSSIATVAAMKPILMLLDIYDPYLMEKVDRVMELAGRNYMYLLSARSLEK